MSSSLIYASTLTLTSISTPHPCNSRPTSKHYAVLLGSTLYLYPTPLDYHTHKLPSTSLTVIGASAWQPDYIPDATGSAAPASVQASPGFRIVTIAGTHVTALAGSVSEREMWVSAIHCGVEARFNPSSTPPAPPTPSLLKPSTNPPRPVYTRPVYTPPAPAPFSCHACSLPDTALTPLPLPLYSIEHSALLCPTCTLAAGVTTVVSMHANMFEIERYQRKACEEGLRLAMTVVKQHAGETPAPGTTPSARTSESTSLENSWEEIPPPHDPIIIPSPHSSLNSLKTLLRSPGYMTLRRRSRVLDVACVEILGDRSSLDDFLADLQPPPPPSASAIASNMSTAIRLLADLSLDPGPILPLFKAVIAFLHGLSYDGVGNVATFFVQIKQIYFRCIPAKTTDDLCKLDLMEDFLLSLATRHVNLGLDLVWSLRAEVVPPYTLYHYDLVRFLREIEIGVCGGEWGEQSLILKDLLRPTPDQNAHLRETMENLAKQRLMCGNYLEHGVRSVHHKPPPPSQAACFMSQIDLAATLGTVANRLFTMDPNSRKHALQQQLRKLNERPSGHSPVSAPHDDVEPLLSFVVDEVHVFRSKARCPILIMMEVATATSGAADLTMLEEESVLSDANSSVLSDDTSDEEQPPPPPPPLSPPLSSLPPSLVLPSLGDGLPGPDEDGDLFGSALGPNTPPASPKTTLFKTNSSSTPRNMDDLMASAMKGRSLSATMNAMLMDDASTPAPTPDTPPKRKISAFGSLAFPAAALTETGEGRREVLETMMSRKNSISGKIVERAKEKVEEIDNRRKEEKLVGTPPRPPRSRLPTAADEVFSSLRMILLESALDDVGSASLIESESIDAATLHPSLAGCGPVSAAIVNAVGLFTSKVITSDEMLECVCADRKFQQTALRSAVEDSEFWVSFAFGESWESKQKRIRQASPNSHVPGYDLVGVICKANDDVRQEVFAMQIIELCSEAWVSAGLTDLWLQPYKIVATGATTGIIECVHNALSLDALKKGENWTSLKSWYMSMGPEREPAAKKNFVKSLASYSIFCYLFQIKDRHNGNILIDHKGHLIHIDFGFLLGIAPGNAWSLETAPFKLTAEMMDLMGGTESPLFTEFVTLFICGFLALQAHEDTFLTVIEITARGSSFPCFQGKDIESILAGLRSRFASHLSREETVLRVLKLIKASYNSYGTVQYDKFQNLTQGIAL